MTCESEQKDQKALINVAKRGKAQLVNILIEARTDVASEDEVLMSLVFGHF